MASNDPHNDRTPRSLTPKNKRANLKRRSTQTKPIGREVVHLADRSTRQMDAVHLEKVQLLSRGLATFEQLRVRGVARYLLAAQMHILQAAQAMRAWAESPAAKPFTIEARAVKHNTATLAEWCRDKEALSREEISKRFPELATQVAVLTGACKQDADETGHYKRAAKKKSDIATVISRQFTALQTSLESTNQTKAAQKVKEAKQEFDLSKGERRSEDRNPA